MISNVLDAIAPDPFPGLIRRVHWSDEEWDNLALRVHRKRISHPEMSLYELLNAVQAEQSHPERGIEAWPADRRRKITGLSMCKPLLPRLREIDKGMFRQLGLLVEENKSLGDTIESLRKRPDREELLASLSSEEIVRRFARRVLDSLPPAELTHFFKPADLLVAIPLPTLFTHVGQSLVDGMERLERSLDKHLAEEQRAETETIPIGSAPLPATRRIAVLGFQSHHVDRLRCALGSRAELIYVPKGETKLTFEVAAPFDHAILWEAHLSAAVCRSARKQVSHDRLTIHRGTFNELCDKLAVTALHRKPR
jgi:hypothetical protein